MANNKTVTVIEVGLPGPQGPAGPAGGQDHSLLSNLDFAHAGHTGFAGLGVANIFTSTVSIQGVTTLETVGVNGLLTCLGGLNASTISGNGSALTSLNGSQITTGTVPDSRLSAKVRDVLAGDLTAGVNDTLTMGSYITFSNLGTSPTVSFGNGGSLTVQGLEVDGSSTFQDVTATIFTVADGGSLSGGGLGLAPGSTISIGNGSVFHVSAFGDVNAAGTVTATSFVGGFTGDGSGLTGLPAASFTGTLAIAHGGTGQTSASAAINALLPTQTSNSGKFLTTNGSAASWATVQVPADNTLHVSITNGSDSTGARGRVDLPFKTLANAQTTASAGDTIVVYPGTYTQTAELGKNGVNWYLMPGVIITRTDGGSVFTDSGSAMVYTVAGYSKISNSGSITVGATVAVVKVSNASSVVHFTCDTIDALATDDDGSGASDAVYQSAGNLHVTADKIHLGAGSISNGWGLYWLNGEMDVVVRNLVIDQGYAIGATVTATPTGDMRVRASEITGNGFQFIEHTSTQVEAKLWVEAFLISGTSFGTIHATGGKTYITAQKIAGCTGSLDATGGVVQCTGGQLWLNAEKVTGTYGTGVLVSGGTAFVDVQHFEDLGHLTQCASVTGGTLNLGPVRATPSLGHGLVVSGGTLNAVSPTITTSGGSTKDLKQTGGTLNVSGGWGTNANGSFVTTGTVTYLPQRVDAGASPTFAAVTASSLNTPEVTSVPTLTIDSSSGIVWLQSASAQGLSVDSQGAVAILGGVGFFGADAVGQYSTTGTTTGFTAGVGTAAKSDSTYTGNSGTKAYTVGDLVKALKALGLLASS